MYYVTQYTKSGKIKGIIAGMGRNKGTWDISANSLRTAQRWAKIMRESDKYHDYKVESL